MTTARSLLPGIALFAAVLSLPAAEATARQPAADVASLFAQEAPLELTLEADLRAVFRDRRDDRPYRGARLTVNGADSQAVALDLSVKTRGYFRRLHLNCDVPPLRLNFKKKKVKGTVFAGQNKLKLVTHCVDRSERFEQYTLQEYLAYKAYNLLTDQSFRVRLVRMTYIDTKGRRDPITRFGFLIEDEEVLAERLGGRVLDRGLIPQEHTDRDLITLVATFQYMIGNTDWAVPTFHNIKVVLTDPAAPPLAVPYDFDWAGLLNTPYAEPDERLGLRNVRQRLYQGYCRSEDEFEAVFDQFRAVEDDLYALFHTMPQMDEKVARKSVAYLEDFFSILESPRAIRRTFARDCRPPPRADRS